MILQFQHKRIIPISDNLIFRAFAEFYNNLVIELFEQVIKYVELGKLIEKLEKSYGEMKLGALKSSIVNLLINYENEIVLKQSVQMVVKEESYIIIRGFILSRQGSTITRTCQCHFCQKLIPKSSPFLCFKCGHLLCTECQKSMFVGMVPICVQCESFESSKGTF